MAAHESSKALEAASRSQCRAESRPQAQSRLSRLRHAAGNWREEQRRSLRRSESPSTLAVPPMGKAGNSNINAISIEQLDGQLPERVCALCVPARPRPSIASRAIRAPSRYQRPDPARSSGGASLSFPLAGTSNVEGDLPLRSDLQQGSAICQPLAIAAIACLECVVFCPPAVSPQSRLLGLVY